MTSFKQYSSPVVAVVACLLVTIALRPASDTQRDVTAHRPLLKRTVSAITSDVPRYRFQVGDTYSYESSSTFDYEGGKMVNSDRDDVWVIQQYDDGSFRLVIRHTSQYRQERDGAAPYEGQERVALGYCDMFLDGRFDRNPSLGYLINPSSIFPRLPDHTHELASGWESTSNSFLGDTTFRLVGQPDDVENSWTFDFVRTSPMDPIYESSASGSLTFDDRQGLVRSITTHSTQGYIFNGESHGTVTLVSAETMSTEQLSSLLAESDTYFAASAEYTRLEQQANHDYGQAEQLMAEAKAVLERALHDTRLPIMTDQLQRQLEQHEQSASDTLEDAGKFAKLIGQPSEDWTLDDLNGAEHSLDDYRGRVVLLDFWYRGCGWCIRGMPQINQVADAFSDQPVTVLGMNTDQELEDARFVVEKMGLNYNNLQATGIPEKYGVTGFPTLVILDQQGTIRDIHVGYADDLFDQISATVERLLSETSIESTGTEEKKSF
ncbi:MAG: redoxin domain-containing protein [Planctomycetaceae bacterium]